MIFVFLYACHLPFQLNGAIIIIVDLQNTGLLLFLEESLIPFVTRPDLGQTEPLPPVR